MKRRKAQKLKIKAEEANDKICYSKTSYYTEEEALNTAKISMRRDLNLKLSVYKCPICRNFHLTQD